MKRLCFYLLSVALLLSACSKDDDPVATTTNEPTHEDPSGGEEVAGMLPGVFSVSDSTTVRFSQGNLQYQPSSGTWRFAPNQWDFVGAPSQTGLNGNKTPNGTIEGSDNALISTIGYSGWIDLFGWGTGNNPTQTSVFSEDYTVFTDWGSVCGLGEGWRTLHADEWKYLRNRPGKSAWATVNEIHGIVMIPESWTTPEGCAFVAGQDDGWNTNVYDKPAWAKMEQAGAIFLPAAGMRNNLAVYDVGIKVRYWSSKPGGPDHSFAYAGNEEYDQTTYRICGLSVRLVR
ncbi:MAG: hypothetical protein KBT04_05635 [Bacteroidales bacterium]|nr:hypothetical protein [Candidatus Colimorpha onthohippi]